MTDREERTLRILVPISERTPRTGHESRLERQSLRHVSRLEPRPARHFASIHAIDRDARVYRAVSRDARGETRGCEQTTDVERVLGLRRRARGERGGNEREGDGGWETRPTGVNVRGTRRRGDAMREGASERGEERTIVVDLTRAFVSRARDSFDRPLDSRSIRARS